MLSFIVAFFNGSPHTAPIPPHADGQLIIEEELEVLQSHLLHDLDSKRPLRILAALADDDLWEELTPTLEEHLHLTRCAATSLLLSRQRRASVKIAMASWNPRTRRQSLTVSELAPPGIRRGLGV